MREPGAGAHWRPRSACSSSTAHGGLKSRSDFEEGALTLPRAKIGELRMSWELAEHLIEKGASRIGAMWHGRSAMKVEVVIVAR